MRLLQRLHLLLRLGAVLNGHMQRGEIPGGEGVSWDYKYRFLGTDYGDCCYPPVAACGRGLLDLDYIFELNEDLYNSCAIRFVSTFTYYVQRLVSCGYLCQ